MKELYKTARSLAVWMPSIVIVGIAVLATNDVSTAIHARRRPSVTQPATISSCSVPSFAPITNLNVGTLPVGLVAADFNGDGKIDLVVANFTSNNLSIFLNNGSGGFGAQPNHPFVPFFPSSIVAADFNGDGRFDLAVTGSGSDDVSILLGNGNGTFGFPSRFSTGANPSAIVVSDFNGDLKIDLAVANADTDDVSILVGNGAGGFRPMPNILVGGAPLSVAAGDFNGDLKQDLAVANFVDDTVSILLGNGTGVFTSSSTLATGAAPISLVVGDFNGDGKSDIAVADSSSDDVSVFRGDGMGGFAPATFYDAGASPEAIAKGDFNGDGKVDLVVANGASDDISVLLNDGTGGFLPATNFSVDITPSAFAVADLNGDGLLDLAVTNSDSDDVSILRNTCGASPAPATMQFSASNYSVGEGDLRVNLTVTRSGDTTSAAKVSFATFDDAGLQNCNVKNAIASPRCDYENTIGALTWTAGDASPKTFSVALVDDSYAEGNEAFRVTLSNPSGATLGTPSTAIVTIVDNDGTDGPNPIDGTNFFVRQQYIDFLGREPDPPGFAGWTSTINNCTGDTTQCDRIHVSQLFFQSEEFQSRGYFIYRFYPVAFGRKPDYAEFVPDLARVSGFLDANQLEAAKVQFIADFMARPAFADTYTSLTNQQYVDMLLNTAGVTLSSRQAMIDGLNNSTLTRAVVLRQIVESSEVSTKYNHQAYAVMEYFGYLRREPDAFYLDWIAVLDQSNDPRGMVTGFVTSAEYRQRFGP
jgi:hypothetical protein